MFLPVFNLFVFFVEYKFLQVSRDNLDMVTKLMFVYCKMEFNETLHTHLH